MPYDYGFDLPDTRHSFYDTEGELVTVKIVRHWHYPEEADEPDFKVSFNIHRGITVTRLPIGCSESKAIDVSHTLYEEDKEATEANNEIDAIYAAERRMGA